MKIILRCDGSEEIGLGHVLRQATVKDALLLEGVPASSVLVAVNYDMPASLTEVFGSCTLLRARADESPIAFIERLIEMQSPDIIVFDGKVDYPEDARSLWRGKTKLVFLDFLPSYPSPLDLNIVPNAHYNPQGGTPFVLYGLEYTIIGSHALARSPGLPRTEQIVITTGGSDPTGVMLHLLKVLAPCQQYAFTFLLGKAFKFRSVIESMRKSLPAHFTLAEYNIDTIRDSRATIATFGVTIYELLYLNVPCLLTAHSRENHEASLVLSSRIAGLPYLGFWSDLTTESVAACIADFLPRAPRPPSSFAAIGHGHRKVAKAIIHFTCSQ